jgi:hypothetical protein
MNETVLIVICVLGIIFQAGWILQLQHNMKRRDLLLDKWKAYSAEQDEAEEIAILVPTRLRKDRNQAYAELRLARVNNQQCRTWVIKKVDEVRGETDRAIGALALANAKIKLLSGASLPHPKDKPDRQ